MTTSDTINGRGLLLAAWLMALLGTVGSLFFSDVMGYAPCVLCWYQRIALYPLVLIIGVGIATGDKRVGRYALPLTLVGLAIAIYHNLLYYGYIPESITPCTEGVPCNAVQLELLGFITIPFMALVGFVSVAACILAFSYKNK
ncbi:MAG: disulfide oxidoreductase [Pyrinomonadaceae bacterium]